MTPNFAPAVVELGNAMRVKDAEGSIEEMDDGTIIVDPDVAPEPKDTSDHYANLAEALSESDLALIADNLIERYESDKQARKEWESRLARGIEIAGFIQPEKGPYEWMATCTYPLIAEATVQFNARALDELFPAEGPIKAIVIGKKTKEREQQAERVQEYMNYQILEEDPGWQDEDDRLLMRLPLDGHAWKKVYRDERLGIQTSKFVSGHEVYVPYSATATHSVPRLCHRLLMHANDVKFEQLVGNWLDVPLSTPSPDDDDGNEVRQALDRADGATQTDDIEQDDPAVEREILEFYVDYNLPRFEHVSEEDQEPTGFALPYIIIIDRHSRQVLKIVRNWKEGDERYRKRINLIPFKFLPGLGFYGQGFLHVLGGLGEAATAALRAMLDSAHRNNVPGGFLTKDMRIKGGTLEFKPGEWTPVDASMEELQKGFFVPPTHPVPEALFKLLGLLVEVGKSFTSATEAMTGTAPSTGPVGTMVALIEQGSKVFSGIHKRLHKSKRDEYRLLAELNAENIPADGYPYDQGNESRQIFAKDFGPAVDVVPVSDPNIFSAQQRIAIAQALLDLATTNPDLYDRREAHRRMLEALKVPDIDGVLLDQSNRPRHDPVAENMLMLNGQMAHAFPDQTHAAHIQVHLDFLRHPEYGGHPDVQPVIAPIMQVHLAQHLAFLYQQQMMQAAGLPYVPIDVEGGQSAGEDEQQLPPELQEEIAVRAAMASAAFMQTQGLPEPPPDPAQIAAEAEMEMRQQELELKRATTDMDLQRKQAELGMKQAGAMADEQRKAAAFTADEQRRMAEWMHEQRRLEQEHEAEMERDEEAADQRLKLDKERAAAQKKAAAQRGKVETGKK